MDAVLIGLVVLAVLLFSAFNILREYERGVIFLLGRFWKVKGPGLIIVIPGIQKMIKVSLRTVVMDVPPQDIITKDNVTVKVNAVLYFRVVDSRRAIIEVEDYLYATSQLSQTTLRSILGQSQLDDLLSKRDEINLHLQKSLMNRLNPGESRSPVSRSKTSIFRRRCRGLWRNKRKRSGNGERKSSTPRENSKRPKGWVMRRTGSGPIPPLYS